MAEEPAPNVQNQNGDHKHPPKFFCDMMKARKFHKMNYKEDVELRPSPFGAECPSGLNLIPMFEYHRPESSHHRRWECPWRKELMRRHQMMQHDAQLNVVPDHQQ